MDLDVLCGYLPTDEARRFAALALPELSRWAIDGRYPDDFDEATRSHAGRALELARAVVAIVGARLDELFETG